MKHLSYILRQTFEYIVNLVIDSRYQYKMCSIYIYIYDTFYIRLASPSSATFRLYFHYMIIIIDIIFCIIRVMWVLLLQANIYSD